MKGHKVALVSALAGFAGIASAGTVGFLSIARLPVAKAAPTLVFSSPADESSLTATVPVRAVVASSSDTVSSVTFYLDGVQLARSAGTAGSFKWDTTRAGDGWHTLSAVAKDSAGRVSETKLAVIVKNFKDTEAPSVSMTWPTEGNRKGGWMTTRASVADNIGVTAVEAYIDGKRVGASSTAPFDTRWSWKKLSKGAHSLQLKAYDAAGNVGVSAPITFEK